MGLEMNALELEKVVLSEYWTSCVGQLVGGLEVVSTTVEL